jgi:hypothetical protein
VLSSGRHLWDLKFVVRVNKASKPVLHRRLWVSPPDTRTKCDILSKGIAIRSRTVFPQRVCSSQPLAGVNWPWQDPSDFTLFAWFSSFHLVGELDRAARIKYQNQNGGSPAT